MKTMQYTAKLLLLLSLGFLGACQPVVGAPKDSATAPAEQNNTDTSNTNEGKNMQKAMFGAGCFWGVEALFREVPGVTEVYSGYSGGTYDKPTYKIVCAGVTGHAEVVEVTYDPEKVSYETLLDTFWKCHDPTQVMRQGPDVGSQYRTAIFYYTDEQKAAAEKSKAALDATGELGAPIATEISPAKTFWKAEEYHQRYLEKHGIVNCHIPRS